MKMVLILASLTLSAQMASAAGFEKAITWGGETSGVAGIGGSYMTGSQALFFNPAGLVSDKAGAMDVSLNVSPTWPTFKAPIENTNTTNSSDSKTYIPGSVLFGQTLNDKLGYGAGVYVSGGNSSTYSNLNFGAAGSGLEAKTDLSIIEIAAGVGYKVMDNLKIGAAYRVAMVNADMSSFRAITSGPLAGKIAQAKYTDLKDTNYFGFKLGAQYKLTDKNHLGLMYRSEMGFKAKGHAETTVPATGTNVSSGDVTIGSVFPTQIALSSDNALSDTWKVLGQVTWIQYSKVTNLAINQNGQAAATQELQLKDQYALHLAGEYTGFGCPLRFGAIYTSQVTNADHALPTATPPGPQYTLTLGTGHAWGDFRTDVGAEYTWGSGTPTGAVTANSVTSYALHLGAGYTF